MSDDLRYAAGYREPTLSFDQLVALTAPDRANRRRALAAYGFTVPEPSVGPYFTSPNPEQGRTEQP